MYGIDFGTTYTVISYKKNDEIHYLEVNNSFLIPTKVGEIENLKRLILDQKIAFSSEFEEILKSFFSYLYKEIESRLNDKEEYKNCIITVPIRFNDLERNIIKKIALLCKFHVIKLLGEPIAAAIGVLDVQKENGRYIVYDLGGGTFDATLLNFQDDMYHVEKVDGLSDFGGVDIDRFISNHRNISLKEAEFVKKTQFISELDELLQKTYEVIFDLTKDCSIKGVILNGGSSYLRNIENSLQKHYQIFKSDNLQLMVAKGACIYGYDFLERQKFLIDVTPFNLGIETIGDKISVLIPMNTPLPTIQKEIFSPVNSKVALKILQGTSNQASKCTLIKHLSIIAKEPFEVSFILDYDGILFVKIIDQMLMITDVFSSNS